MNFQQLVLQRKSVRNYNPENPVQKGILDKILEAGRMAPSAANRQPWKFYLISDPENLTKIRKCYNRPWFHDAPHVLVVAGKAGQAWTRAYDGYNSLETDLTIVMDHMILAATDEGVGTCWIAAFNPDELKKSGLFEEDETVFAITPLGYPRMDYKPSTGKDRKSAEEVVVYL